MQSKSKNLSETITYIRNQLIEEKQKAESQLRQMNIDMNSNRHGVNEYDDVTERENLQQQVRHCRSVCADIKIQRFIFLRPFNEPLEWKLARVEEFRYIMPLTACYHGFLYVYVYPMFYP